MNARPSVSPPKQTQGAVVERYAARRVHVGARASLGSKMTAVAIVRMQWIAWSIAVTYDRKCLVLYAWNSDTHRDTWFIGLQNIAQLPAPPRVKLPMMSMTLAHVCEDYERIRRYGE